MFLLSQKYFVYILFFLYAFCLVYKIFKNLTDVIEYISFSYDLMLLASCLINSVLYSLLKRLAVLPFTSNCWLH